MGTAAPAVQRSAATPVWNGHSRPLPLPLPLTLTSILTFDFDLACHPEEAESHGKRAIPDEELALSLPKGPIHSLAARGPPRLGQHRCNDPHAKKMFRPTFNRGRIIYYQRIGLMSPNWRPRNRRPEAICTPAFLAFAALFALLAIRTAPPDFPRTSLHHSSFNAVSSHDERPRFDSSGLQWSAPVGHFLPFPPAADYAHLTPSPQLWSALQSKGFHYNRPPPSS